MSEDTPLTALCAICHIGALKYTCPRCSIHTCSLPCVKLHKTRASCSGVRDPTAYRKRGDLATAASIDSDFNFITSVERSLSCAEDALTAADGGSDIHAAGLSRPRQTDSSRLERLVRERGVIWRRAPRGMWRRQENETRVEHSGVTWTAEFVFADGSRRMCVTPDTSTVGEALERAVRPPAPAKHLGKRKRGSRRGANNEQIHEEKLSPNGGVDKAETQPTKSKLESSSARPPTASPEHGRDRLSGSTFNIADPNSTAQSPPPPPPPFTDQHIYIHRPNTPSKFKVLAPLQRSATLLAILAGRTVMEFPTFYIKAEPPDALAAPFMAEETYLREYGEDVVPLAAAAGGTGTLRDVESGPGEAEDGEIDESQEDLKRDVDEVLRALVDPGNVLSVLEQDLAS